MRRISPVPAPEIRPPTTQAAIVSCRIREEGTTDTKKVIKVTTTTVFAKNFRPIFRNETRNSGRFIR